MKTDNPWKLKNKKDKLIVVSPAYQPSKADFEEEIVVPQMNPQGAAMRLLRPVEIRHVPKPRR